MKILLLHGAIYAGALRALGHDVSSFEFLETLDAAGERVREYTLEAAVRGAGFEPDLVIVQIFGAQPFPAGLDACPYPLVAYVFDSALNHFWLRHYLRLFDHVFVDFKDSLQRLAEDGVQAHWLPYAIDPEEFPRTRLPKDHDIAFVGVREHRPRRSALLETLREHFDVVVAGGLGEEQGGEPRLSGSQVGELYARSRIVVNDYLYDGINFRVFEALAAGSLLLTEATQNGLTDLFEDGVHLVTYTPRSLIERTRYYLDHAQERETIATAGRELVLARHTRVARVRELLETVASRPAEPGERDSLRRRVHEAQAVYGICRRWPGFVETELPRAVQALEGALDACPADGPVAWTLGLCHAEWGDPERAVALLERAREAIPEDPLPALHLGQLLGELKRPSAAMQEFRRALERCGSLPEARLAALREALDAGSMGAQLWLALGGLLEALGRGAEPNASAAEPSRFGLHANEYLERAHREGGGPRALVALGSCLAAGGLRSSAIGAFLRVIEQEPAHPEAVFRAGELLLTAFRREAGLKLLRTALRIEPELAPRIGSLELGDDERRRVLG